jgi:hypothetical protein
MPSATLNLRLSPRRIVSEKEAAACTVLPVQFPDGAKLYDLHDLDAWLDGLKGASLSASADEILAKLG